MEPNREELDTVVLESSDKQTFLVSLKIAQHSIMLKEMLDAIGTSGDEAVPLAKVQGRTLRVIIEWLEHHKVDPAMELDVNGDVRQLENINQWDREFMKKNEGIMFEMLNAANYMDIKGLTNLICKLLAERISGKSAEEVRKMFNIQNDLSEEAEEQILKENQWAQEK